MEMDANSTTDLVEGKIAPVESKPGRGGVAGFFETDHLMVNVHKRAFRGGLVTLLAQAVRLLLQVGSAAVLGRLLRPRDFGLLAMVASITRFIALFKDLGLSNATIQRPQITHAQISSLFWINCALGIGVMLVIASMAPVVAWFYHEPELVWITLILSSNFIFSGLTVQHQALLRRQMRFKLVAIISVVSMAVGVTTAVSMAAAGWRYWSLVGAESATSIVNCIMVWASCRWRPGAYQRGAGVGPMLKFGGHLTGFTVINYFTRNFDNILIGRVLGAAPLGIYARAYNLLMLPISQFNVPLAAVLLPGLSRLQDNPPEYRKLFLRAVSAMLLVTVPVVVFATFFAYEVVLIWLGARWLPVASVFQLLSPAAAVGAIVFAPNWLSQSLGRPAQQLRYALISAPICVAGFIIGIRWGVAGVAASFSITFVGLLWAYIWYATRNSPVRFFDIVMRFLGALIPACIAGVITWTLRGMMLSDALMTLTVCGPIFILIYISVALIPRESRSVIFGAGRALAAMIPRRDSRALG
jgi:O-antigen/teichoic acid export membrane protein